MIAQSSKMIKFSHYINYCCRILAAVGITEPDWRIDQVETLDN